MIVATTSAGRATGTNLYRAVFSLGQQSLSQNLQSNDSLLTADRGKVIQELIQIVTTLQVVNQSINRHASTHKHGIAAVNLWIA